MNLTAKRTKETGREGIKQMTLTDEELKKLLISAAKAGVPDLHLPVARGGYHGLYIELKAGKNRQTDKQKEWQKQLRKQGYLVTVCYGWQEAAQTLTGYLELGTMKEAGKEAAQDI